MDTFIENLSLNITKLVVFVVYVWFMYYVLTSPFRVDKWFGPNPDWKAVIKINVLRAASGILAKHSSDVTAEICVTRNDYIDDKDIWILKGLAMAVVMGTYIILVQTIEHMYRVIEDLQASARSEKEGSIREKESAIEEKESSISEKERVQEKQN
ncbi:predicted protein [Meyerozyma guilliermondii ATCC 6260]|uniref:Uncharacterized protein n=1 Tax=Meyerozyma guilliermondii (strain ATCC 6260 / CBS 566 / DSM 6381 / JCM 1539 / NBRC 10279 / NRRL Y-324) TaxID=294746 RepID=A5DNK4_PICGU|nr:uncharacterized protein PGUG_04855 [Meyerozyma guilliermondii ATCC 6260]EDK40757.1 predicted protein [Meyerozyma guilliermondii ATCC 6260]